MRVDNNSNALNISRLCILILESIKSMIQDYSFLYSEEEMSLLRRMLERISSHQDLDTVNLVESELKALAFKTWEYEEKKGNHYIHWLKHDVLNTENPVISATFGDVEVFCNSVVGIRYKTTVDGFLGAREKDAGVVVEPPHRQSMFTIKVLDDGRVVNSYNLGTPLMTPKLAMDTSQNDYQSRHNEIMLDASIATPVEVVCNDSYYTDLAIEISHRYGIPFPQDESQNHL